MPTYLQPHTSANTGKGPNFINAKSGSAVKNNGGTLFYGGSLAASVFQSVNYLGYRSGISEARPYLASADAPNSNIGAVKALSAGTFASMTAGKYVLFGFCSQLAGVANTLLNIQGQYGSRRSENVFAGVIRTSLIVLAAYNAGPGGWNYVTGSPLTAPLNLVENQQPVSTDVVSTETLPTYAVPGRITYMFTGIKASTYNYSAKTD